MALQTIVSRNLSPWHNGVVTIGAFQAGKAGKGISDLVMKKCDYLVHLPMMGKISSLNASVSAGILLYEIHNKRFPL